MPPQPYAIPQVPYRPAVGYPQQLPYGAPMIQQPLEVAQPNIPVYNAPIQYDMPNYAIPQRASYIPPPPPPAPVIRDDSAIMVSPSPPPLVRRTLTPPPVLRSQVAAFPEPTNYFNPVNVSPARIVSHGQPVSEIISQPNALPVSLSLDPNTIQYTNNALAPTNVVLPQVNYNPYGAGAMGVVEMRNNLMPSNNPNYLPFLQNAGIIQQGINTTQFQPQGMIYSENLPNSMTIPNQPYQLPTINQAAYSTGIVQSEMIQPIQKNYTITPNPIN